MLVVHLISVNCLITADTYIYGLQPRELLLATVAISSAIVLEMNWKADETAPPLSRRSQDGARLGQIVPHFYTAI